MTSKAEWLALAERCEAATGPDREIDCLIAVAVNDVPAGYMRHDAFSWTCPQPPFMPLAYSPAYFTYSLDAITALIERELPDAGWSAHKYYDVMEGRIMRRGQDTIMRYSATPAIALCAAFCRAMAEAAE